MKPPTKFRPYTPDVEAMQWHRDGDSPWVQRYDDRLKWWKLCKRCNRDLDAHGKINTGTGPQIVCPGDWVVRDMLGVRACSTKTFRIAYQPTAGSWCEACGRLLTTQQRRPAGDDVWLCGSCSDLEDRVHSSEETTPAPHDRSRSNGLAESRPAPTGVADESGVDFD